MTTETESKKLLKLSSTGKLELKKSQESSQVRQQFSHGRAKIVQVEVKRRRTIMGTSSALGTSAIAAKRDVRIPSVEKNTPVSETVLVPPKIEPEESRSLSATEQQSERELFSETPKIIEDSPPTEPTVSDKIEIQSSVDVQITDNISSELASVKEQNLPPTLSPAVAKKTNTGSKRASALSARGKQSAAGRSKPQGSAALTDEERANRVFALQNALRDEELRKRTEIENAARMRSEDEARRKHEEKEAQRQAEEAEIQREKEERRKREEDAKKEIDDVRRRAEGHPTAIPSNDRAAPVAIPRGRVGAGTGDEEERGPVKGSRRGRGAGGATRGGAARPGGGGANDQSRRRGVRMTVTQALDQDGQERTRSMASVRRQRQRDRDRQVRQKLDSAKIVRDVVIPEFITVGELANRMAMRGAEVIKMLMKMDVMATITQSIDGDMAEMIASEFGHNVKRVSEADVEIGLRGKRDEDEFLLPRPPIITIMGHVDHGKTSLLDALRETDVATGEAGGITQHIGAYQIEINNGQRLTFIDTPGHAAFSEMRARGANITDIVVLVVAADDGIMPQTVEAISHARAAAVPMIVAINKCDKPDANPTRVQQELLQHNIQIESLGGEIQCIEVSALTKIGLDKLEEAILLQAELMELRANPDRTAEGVVVEAKLEQGRGSVATILVQRGILSIGDVFVCGTESGRVRALINDRGSKIDSAYPAQPVEVLGLQGTPQAGDDFVVVVDESRARDITAFRQRQAREALAATAKRSTLEQMFNRIQAGEAQTLPIVIKSDVQGSIEAISSSLEKLGTEEVKVRVLHQAVGGITESDIVLANASHALVLGFNVRANPQARGMAKRDNIEIRYYSIIYQLIDDIRQMLSGMLAPARQENFLGYAQIRNVFNITKIGKVAGCMITEGQVKRGTGVRLLRDNVVVHEGTLKTLRRFKDEVREVQQGYECGMAFENYHDIKIGDQIECFEIQHVIRTL